MKYNSECKENIFKQYLFLWSLILKQIYYFWYCETVWIQFVLVIKNLEKHQRHNDNTLSFFPKQFL